MPTNTELAKELRELKEEVADLRAAISSTVTVSAGGQSRRPFIESVIASAVARDGARCLDPWKGDGAVAHPPAIKAIIQAEACARLGLEMLEDEVLVESAVESSRPTDGAR